MVRLLTFIAFGAGFMASFGQNTAVSRHLANVVGPTDDRIQLTREFTGLGLQPREVYEIRNSVGYVTCQSDPKIKKSWVTGFLIAPDVVVTVAHVLISKEKVPEDLSKCSFQTQGDRPQQVFSFNISEVEVGSKDPHREKHLDWAVIRLKTPVPGATLVRVIEPTEELLLTSDLIPVIARREKAGDNDWEQLVQKCKVRKMFRETNEPNIPSTLYSDCDNTPGGSGGPNLVRIGGRLFAVGIFESAGLAPDGAPYNGDRNFDLSLAQSVAFDGPFLASIKKFIGIGATYRLSGK